MLGDNTTIMVAASGALIPAGMRRLDLRDLLERAGHEVVALTRMPESTRLLERMGAKTEAGAAA